MANGIIIHQPPTQPNQPVKKNGMLSNWSRAEKFGLLTLSLFGVLALTFFTGFSSETINHVFQAKNITFLTLGAFGLAGVLALIFSKKDEKEKGFVTKKQMVFFAALLATAIIYIALGNMNIGKFGNDSYIQFLKNMPVFGYCTTILFFMALISSFSAYNMPKE